MGRIDKVPTARRRTITNKTRLKVLEGDAPGAELVLLEEDDNKHKSLDIDTAGVEHEDAKEEHLVQVLAAAARRIGSGRASKPNEEVASASIPIPDATGVVDDWQKQYPSGRWVDPNAYIKASDSVEQSIEGFLLNGISYDMDERDVAWLDKHNSTAKGEGTSASAGSPDRLRAAKMRGKDVPVPEQPSFVITENEFELTMGLFEKFTDEKCPYLHLDVSGLPPLAEYQTSFAIASSTPYYFASFHIPTYCHDPSLLIRLAQTIYPYWKERKISRNGRKIIPQLNLEEANDTDPFVCFRRRDAKAVRKTRRADNTPADKITRLRMELQNVSDLAASVLTREMKKAELGRDNQAVLEARLRLFDHKRKFPALSSPQDDQLLIEQERVPPAKRPRPSEPAGILKIPRRPRESTELPSPYAAPETVEAINPHERAAAVLREIDRQYEPKRQPGWEDYLDLPVNLPSGAAAAALFRTISDVARAKDSRRSPSVDPSPPSRQPRSIRVRMGRGGRFHVDRRSTGRRDPAGPPSPVPMAPSDLNKSYMEHFARRVSVFSVDEPSPTTSPSSDPDTPRSDGERAEAIRRVDERWRFDQSDLAADDEDRNLLDDFETRYLFTRANSFTDTDLAKLSIDETHLQKANNYAMQAQTPALRAITNARNEQQARMLEQRARAQAQQAQARAAAAAAAAAGEQPSSTNATASSPRPPSGFPQSSPAPSSSTPAPQPPTPNSNGAQLASSAPPQSPVPVANGLQANGSQTPQTPHTPLQQYTQMQQAALLQQAKQRNGLQTVPRPSQQPNGIARPPLTPQQQAALTQQQVERMQQANMTHAHAQQAQLMANGGSGQNMLAAEAAMRQAHAAAAAAARSSPSMSHQQPADPNGLTNGQARPTPSQQGQMALPQVNGFPQMPFGVYHAQLAQQPAQANGMQNGAGTNGQMNGGPMSYYAANGNPQQPQQYLQVLQMAAQMKNGANGPQITNGIPNAMLAQFPQGQNGVSRPGIMPPPQQQQQQPAQPGMWVAPGMPTPNSASAALQSMGISPTTNMSLKMPPTRQMAWSRQNSDTGAGLNGSQPPQQNGMMGPPTGSPVQQHMSSPTLAGRSSPVRLVNGGQQGRNSPMNMHPGSSPVMDQHGTPQPHRQTSNPSPLGLPQDMSMLPHQSPHLAMRSPAHQHQVIGSSPG